MIENVLVPWLQGSGNGTRESHFIHIHVHEGFGLTFDYSKTPVTMNPK